MINSRSILLNRWWLSVLRIWRGEISLYRAAYGLGGLGVAVLSLCEDFVMDRFASAGGSLGWLLFFTIALCELAFAGLCVVATQRAALRQNAEARRYSPIAIGLALLFVYVQFVLTAAWIGWDGLAEVGFRTSNQTTFFEDIELHVEPLPGPITNRAL